MINKEHLGSITDLITEIAKTMTEEEQLKTATLIRLSQAIRDERRRLKMSQEAFANHMKVKQAMVSKWESGRYNFTIGTLAHIATALNLNFSNNLSPKSKILILEQQNWNTSRDLRHVNPRYTTNLDAG